MVSFGQPPLSACATHHPQPTTKAGEREKKKLTTGMMPFHTFLFERQLFPMAALALEVPNGRDGPSENGSDKP